MPEAKAQLEPVALSAPRWAPFGWLPVADTDPADGEHRLEFEWADPHLNIIGHARNEVPAVPGGLRCEMLYRHETHTQSVMSLDHPCVIAVAPPGTAFTPGGDPGVIEAFELDVLEPVVLHRGTWHWGPFPLRAEAVRLFNVQGLRYPEDNAMVDLSALGLSVEIATH